MFAFVSASFNIEYVYGVGVLFVLSVGFSLRLWLIWRTKFACRSRNPIISESDYSDITRRAYPRPPQIIKLGSQFAAQPFLQRYVRRIGNP
jgi:hypothetical protein